MTREVARLRRSRGPDEPLSDEALARACAGGDAAAIAGLFDRFQPAVTRYVGRLLGPGGDLEDVVQATFLLVARGTATYDPTRGSVTTWLFALATNVVRHHRRSAARRLRTMRAVRVEPTRTVDVHAEADARRQLERAREALAALQEKLREAFVLCELEGLSAKEAARVLGTSETVVWKRVSKARASLREAVLGAGS